MKKILLYTLFLSLLVIGCGKKEEPVIVVQQEPEVVVADDNVVEPLDIDPMLEDLTNRMFNVSFTKDDFYTDEETGSMGLKMKVYDYEQYNLTDINNLAVGDTLYIRDKEVDIQSIEFDDYGIVYINGGLESDGHWLKTDNSGIYYEIVENDHHHFNEIGEISVLVSDDFVFIDDSDLDNIGVEYQFDVFMEDETPFYFNFMAENTVAKIEDGKLLEIHRFYIP